MQDHKDRVENLSDHDQLIKLCSDAGFMDAVAVGQYFVTEDVEKFSKFDGHVARREHTLPRDDES